MTGGVSVRRAYINYCAGKSWCRITSGQMRSAGTFSYEPRGAVYQPGIYSSAQGCRCGYLHGLKGRRMDNVMIKRIWRSAKWECLYLRKVETDSQVRKILRDWFQFYSEQRPPTAFDGHQTIEVYCERNLNLKAV